jgi:molybdate transport system ATP-binding protein
MTLSVTARHAQGVFTLDVALHTEAKIVALFGPSGSGKTTVLNVIAGLIRPHAGRVVVEGAVLLDTAAGVFTPPHRRRVGYVFQEGRLFPHLSVRRNLLYGRALAPRAERYGSFGEVVALLGLEHLLDRPPATLSGGEKQRVAIGRALLASPRLILMDEPLASLDERRKRETLPYIERLRDELHIPVVYVSHSLPEIECLTSEIVRLEDGRIVPGGAMERALPFPRPALTSRP